MLERLSAGERPDILVLDWHMDEISGLDACRYVRSVADGAELPIIVLTASGNHEDLLAGLDAGANDFVRKPCDETELNARVAALVRTKRLHARLAVAESSLRDEASFRERFLAILAHDLRQPLNVFALGSETLAAADTPQAVRNKVQALFAKTTGRMQRMIDELLDFSQVVDEVRLGHPGRTITLDADASCTGTWDADRVAQVAGMLENALAHSTPGSTVGITVTAAADGAHVTIENHGEPLAAELVARLFDPFRRGSSRPVRNQGLGLGLYIVDQIARAHGGTVKVRSDEGLTRFDVMLPFSAHPSG